MPCRTQNNRPATDGPDTTANRNTPPPVVSQGSNQPDLPQFIRITTSGLRGADAFDFWRQRAFYNFEPDKPDARALKYFSARAQGIVSKRGHFFTYHSAAVSGRRSRRQAHRDGIDDLELGLVLAGQRTSDAATGRPTTARKGEFFIYDATQPSRIHWQAHRGIHLTLRRSTLHTYCGHCLPDAGDLAAALSASALAPFLRSQMRLLAQHIDALAPPERRIMLDQILTLAVTTLASLPIMQQANKAQAPRQRLYVAARRHIEARLDDTDLSPASVAGAMHCSRATLYRAFADQGLPLAGFIREQRLRRARQLLAAGTPDRSISRVAASSGFADMRTFRRAFHNRFGMTPTQLSASAVSGETK